MATLPQPSYYEVLGVPQGATAEQVKAAFQKLVTDFHAAGKPKNIDDVEWLRSVAHAYHALNDDSNNQNGGTNFGYDFAAIKDMSRAVDDQLDRQKFAILHTVLGLPLAETIWAHLKLRNI
jgi:DnaJ domain